MKEGEQRLLIAFLLTITLHAALFSWQMIEKENVPPNFLPVRRITVSLNIDRDPPPIQAEKTPIPDTKTDTSPEIESPVQKTAQIDQDHGPALPVSPEGTNQPSLISRKEPIKKNKVPPTSSNIKSAESDAPVEALSSDPIPSSPVIQKATPLYQVNPPPSYPRLAKRRGWEGLVVLAVCIDVSGKVVQINIQNSSGHGVLDQAALEAVRNWRFSPGVVAGELAEMWVTVPVRFRLS